jgi:hypothetical protein
VVTWPCDEINPIWRRYHPHYPHDELPAELADARVQAYLRGAFARRARCGGKVVLEKTCANTLRVEYVDRALPDACYVYVVRDGCDAVASALRRWTSGVALSYVLKKARYVPWQVWPQYAARFAAARIYRRFSPQGRVRTWGPVFAGMPQMLRERPLLEVVAAQWRRCVTRAEQALERIDAARVHRVRYEDLVARPIAELEQLLRAVGVVMPTSRLHEVAGRVRGESVGKWRRELSRADQQRLEELLNAEADASGRQVA